MGLSRAKDVCIIVGDLKRLAGLNKKWRDIVEEAIGKEQVWCVKGKDTVEGVMKNNKKHLMRNLGEEGRG